MDSYTLSLLKEYKDHVDGMRSGSYTTEEIRALDSERLVLHEQLCALLNFDRSVDMYQYARRALHAARGSNLQ